MVKEGVSSFKLFMAYPDVLMVDDATIFTAMKHTSKTGALVCMHAENGNVIDLIVKQALADGKKAPIYHALTRPTTAEGEAVNRAIALAEMAGAPVYIVHLSSNDALEKAIEINSLSSILEQTSSTLSGGQKRRLNIAIGLLNSPKIIYFDEPTVGVDPKSRNEILDSIKEYKNLGITVVYTSHYMTEIERICDEVAIIAKGKLVEQDILENMLTNRVSNKVSIEIVYNEDLNLKDVIIKDNSIIETTEEKLYFTIDALKAQNIAIKQIRYGSTNLEKHFLDISEASNV
ncbi:MAG: ATP-binding cassette domain-containing protein [Thiovulaceae bacterium]|nr:ATP-binding cassette domain-containing protein [Sulfurimonadaceae bacterium]